MGILKHERNALPQVSWRQLGWGAAALLLLLPAAGMLVTSEVDWGPGDFLILAGMLAGLGAALELFARLPMRLGARLLAATAAVGVFLLLWAELAVGIF